MPYKKERYHDIPRLIQGIGRLDRKVQESFIDALTEEELRYFITHARDSNGEASDGYPTPFHGLVASQVPAVVFLLDKFLKMQSAKKSEAKEESGSQKKILDDIANLSVSNGNNLLHLMTFCNKDDFKKFLQLVSPKVLAVTALQKNKKGRSAFGCVTKLNSECFLSFLEMMPSNVVEEASSYSEPKDNTVSMSVVLHQPLVSFHAYSKKLSTKARQNISEMTDTLGQSGFAYFAQNRSSAAFKDFIADLPGDVRDEIALKQVHLANEPELHYLIKYQDSSAFFAFFNKLSPRVKDKVFGLKDRSGFSLLPTVLEFQDASVVRLFVDNIRCPFDFLSSDIYIASRALDRNAKLSESGKEIFHKDLSQMHFLKHPSIVEAVRNTPDAFLNFVCKYFKDAKTEGIDYAKWCHILCDALDVCDINNQKIYGPLIAFALIADNYASSVVMSNSYRNTLCLRLFQMRETQFSNAKVNALMGFNFTFFGSPFQDVEKRVLKSQDTIIASQDYNVTFIASQDYNVTFRRGLQCLKKAADDKHVGADLLLTDILVPFKLTQGVAPIVIAERKCAPENKATPSGSDVTFFREIKSEAKQGDDINKKLEKMIEKLDQRIDQFDKMGWNKLSSQFEKATKEKFDIAIIHRIADLAFLKHRIERAEMGSSAQKSLFAELHKQLEDAVQRNPKKSGVLSYLYTDPYTAWLSATQTIVRECSRVYYERHVPIEIVLGSPSCSRAKEQSA